MAGGAACGSCFRYLAGDLIPRGNNDLAGGADDVFL